MKSKVQEILSHADIKINGSRAWDIKVKNEKFYHKFLKIQIIFSKKTYPIKFKLVMGIDFITISKFITYEIR